MKESNKSAQRNITKKKAPAKKKAARPRTGGLTVAQIINTGIRLADSGGIESLSMRKLAAELNVEAMSLYHHIPSRESLLDGMVDQVFEELSATESKKSIPWQKWILEQAAHMRRILLKHPWSVALLDSRRNPGTATLTYQNHRLGRLREAGFSMDLAAHAVALQDSFVYGFVIQELALPFDGEVDLEQLRGFQEAMEAGQYPHLAEMVETVVSRKGYSFAREFEYGLNLLIEGLEMRFNAQ